MKEIIKKPTKPSASDCCEGSCDPCVWDIFYDDLSSYRKQQRTLNNTKDTLIDNDINS